jgi:subtilisin family serine protease
MPQPKSSPRWLALTTAFIIFLSLIPGIGIAQSPQRPEIHLQYATFDPLGEQPRVPSEQILPNPAGAPSTYLLQFTGPVHEEWKTTVEQIGVRLYGYIPDFAFIARLDETVIDNLTALPFVRWVGPYYPEYRLEQTLQRSPISPQDSSPVVLNVQTLPDINLNLLADQVEALGGKVVQNVGNDLGGYLRVELQLGLVGQLAALDGVLWVEPYFPPELYNDVGGGTIMKAGVVRAGLGLYGSGQIVAVADSGLDVGTTGSGMSADFAGRILAGQAICATFGGRTTWNDFLGHGTHVSGSVLGSGVLSGSNPASHQYTNSFAGVAPEAQLVFQSVDNAPGDGLECVPNDLSTYIFGPAYGLGARIHTNSWGGPTGGTSYDPQYGGYTLSSQSADQAAWNYKNMLILFAAGNSGVDADSNGKVDPDSISSPGTAKNVITVGASENDRPDLDTTWGYAWSSDYPVDPINQDRLADNPDGMAAFSGRGPTDDGRVKPDLVAPGTFVISDRSHDPDAGIGWGEYDSNYVYNGGTSMATPLTAGAAALVREWLVDVRNITTPSAALMKAILINGAADMSPGQYTSPQEIPTIRPNNVSGWGRVDLAESLKPPAPRQVWVKDNPAGLNTGGSLTYTLSTGPAHIVSQHGTSTRSENSAPGAPRELKIDSLPARLSSPDSPNQPMASDAAVSFVLDDGSPENFIGLLDITQSYAYQFIWLNRFTPDPSEFPFTLDQIQVMFYDDVSGTYNVSVGDAIDLVVYQDADGNPANGATLLATFQDAVEAVDGTTWSVYNLSSPVVINGPGDVLIGVINRYVNDGVTPKSYPASLDTTSSNSRSWIGWWSGSPPDPAVLPPDYYFEVMSGTFAGNWLIRGYGQTGASGTPSPSPTAPSPTGTPPPSTGGPLHITLAWTDYPGTASAGKALVNNLDLEVIAPDGAHYYGNAGIYGSGHSCLRDGKWDTCNNVEGVLIPNAINGAYSVIVHGYNVPYGPQPFALVASGDYIREGGDFIADHFVFLPLVVR